LPKNQPEESIVSRLRVKEALGAETQIKLCPFRRRPREIERSGVEELAQLRHALVVLRGTAQGKKRRRGYLVDVGVRDLTNGQTRRHKDEIEKRFIPWW